MKYHITRVITSLLLLAIISSCVERRKVKDIMLEFVSSDITPMLIASATR